MDKQSLFLRIIAFFAFAICSHAVAHAISEAVTPDSVTPQPIPTGRSFHVSITLGQRLNVGGNDNTEWFGKQKFRRGDFNLRLAYYFKNHWGPFVDFRAGSIHDSWTFPGSENFNPEDIYCAHSNPAFAGVVGVGAAYKTNFNRWLLFGRIGYFYGNIDCVRMRSTYYYDPDNPCREYTDAHRDTHKEGLELGATLGFRMSKCFSFIFDINYRVPLDHKACVTIENYVLDESTSRYRLVDTQKHYSASWAHDLTFSLGIELNLDLYKKPKKNKKR